MSTQVVQGYYDSLGNFIEQEFVGGAASVFDSASEFRHYDDGTTWDYYAEASPDAALTPAQLEAESVWRVSRINKSTGDEQWAGGGTYSLTAVNLADVQGHF